MKIGIVNQSLLAPDAQVRLITKAISYQISRHICPAWGLAPIPVSCFGHVDHVPDGWDAIVVRDTLDDASALGYHTENGGVVSALIGVKSVLDGGGAILHGDLSVAAVVSHEAAEMAKNPNINLWADSDFLPRGYTSVALEIGDPVQNDSYELNIDRTPISVSNFVTPDWFDGEKTHGHYDYLGKLTAPFTMTKGGYLIVRKNSSAESEVFGDIPAWKQDRASRASRMRET